MKYIELTQNKKAIVDDEDYEWLNQWKWCLLQNRYAHRNNNDGTWVRMHRAILNCPKSYEVDHINGEGLDNRRSNLRIVSHQQNLMNTKIPKNNVSGIKGVSWRKDTSKWRSFISYSRKQITLGCFDSLEEAISARLMAESEYFGDYARR